MPNNPYKTNDDDMKRRQMAQQQRQPVRFKFGAITPNTQRPNPAQGRLFGAPSKVFRRV